MDFRKYQALAKRTLKKSNETPMQLIARLGLGLCGESGEVAEKIKKLMRDKGGDISTDDRLKLAKEIGDVLWYCALLSQELGLDLQTIAVLNIMKLEERNKKGKIKGEGDER